MRAARADDISTIPDIHSASRRLFTDIGQDEFVDVGVVDGPLIATSLAQGGLLVVEVWNELVGFALCERFAETSHLHQMSVLPEHTGRGIGSRLLQALVAHRAEHGDRQMTLVTYSDIPWNRPFYLKHGFGDIEAPPHIELLLHAEAMEGIDLSRRVVMSLSLTDDP